MIQSLTRLAAGNWLGCRESADHQGWRQFVVKKARRQMTGLMHMVMCLADTVAAVADCPPMLVRGECRQRCGVEGG